MTLFRKVWNEMKRRCLVPTHSAYHNYGARGITVSKSWLIFDNFYDDMYPSYKQGLTLDRINNNRGYSRENCRWITRKEQMQNTRINRYFVFNGKSLTLSQWADELNFKRSMLSMRFYKYKWPIEKVLTTPKRDYPK